MSFRRLIPAVLATLWLSAGSAVADGIMVTDAFARASAGAAKNGAAFMTLKNHAGRDDHMVAVRTARARKAVHTHIHDQGVAYAGGADHGAGRRGGDAQAGRRPCHVDGVHGL